MVYFPGTVFRIALGRLIHRPYLAADTQLDNLSGWFVMVICMLMSSYIIAGLALGVVLLIVLIQRIQHTTT